MEMFSLISFEVVLNVFVRTLVIFFFAFLILRLLGKRHLAHLTYLDLLLVIALGSAVGDVMIYSESVVHLFASIISISVVGLLVKLFNELSSHSPQAGSLIVGSARLIIENGKVITEALKQEDMSEEDVMRILRVKGFQDIKGIKKAFIEADGEVSIVINHGNHSK